MKEDASNLPEDEKNASAEPPEEGDAIDENEDSMGVLDHLEELRFVLLKSVSAFLFFCFLVGCLLFLWRFMDLIYWPLHQAQSMAGHEVGEDILRTRSPMSVFSVIIQVIFLGGFGLALPFILYFVSLFIAPGLTPREKRVLLPVCMAVLVLFLLGAAFSYGILLPFSLAVSLQFNDMLGFQPVWEPASYISLVVWMTLGLGLIFQFPLVLVLLQYLEIVATPMLRLYRRHAVVAILILSALATPGGDPLTLGLMSVPLYMLYELSIFVGAKVVAAKHSAAEVAES